MLPLKKTKEPVFWFVFTSKMSFFGNSKELQFKTSKLWQTVGKSGEQRREGRRLERLWVLRWLQPLGSLFLLGQEAGVCKLWTDKAPFKQMIMHPSKRYIVLYLAIALTLNT